MDGQTRKRRKSRRVREALDSLILTGGTLATIVEAEQGVNDACDSWYGSIDNASSPACEKVG